MAYCIIEFMLMSVQRGRQLLLALPLMVASLCIGCGGGGGGGGGSGGSGGSSGQTAGSGGGTNAGGSGGRATGSGGHAGNGGGGGGAGAGGMAGHVGAGGKGGSGGTRDGGIPDGAAVDGGGRGYCDQDSDCVFRADDGCCGSCIGVNETPSPQLCPGVLCARPPGGCSCKNHMCERGALMQGDACQLQQDSCGNGLKCCRACGAPGCMTPPRCTQTSSLSNRCPAVPLSQ